jgi:hypothetical protein
MSLFLRISVTTRRRIIADSATARLLRERNLEGQLVNGRPVLVDLRQIDAMNASAIDELLVRWITTTRTVKAGVVVCVWVTSPDLRSSIDLVLRDAKHAAYAWVDEVDPEPRVFRTNHPRRIGDVTQTNKDTLATIIARGGAVTGKDAAGEHEPASTATNRLTELAVKGFVMRSAQPGRAGDLFIYPFCARGREEIQLRVDNHNRARELAAV